MNTNPTEHPATLMQKISRRSFLRGLGLAGLGTAMVYLGGTTMAQMVDNPDEVEIVRLRLRLPSLDSAFDGFRLVQISDVHMDEWMDRARFESILSICKETEPDLLVITGDFLTRDVDNIVEPLIQALKPYGKSMDILAVLGNNDHRYNADIMHQVLKECNVFELTNTVYTINKGNASLNFAGLDDVYLGKPKFNQLLDSIPPEGTNILLVHEPDFADTSEKTGIFDLSLSGHSHGGQINIPGIGAPITPPYGHKYVAGLYQVGNMYQYTNRGLGFSQMPPKIRINCPPEITVFTLMS